MSKSVFVRIYLTGGFLLSCLCLWNMVHIPHDPAGGIIFGFSLFRLVLLGILGILFFATLALSAYSFFRPSSLNGFISRMEASQSSPLLRIGLPMICGAAAFFGYLFIFWGTVPENLVSYHERLLPLVIWLTVSALGTLALMILLRANWSGVGGMKEEFSASLAAAGFLFVVFLFIVISRSGLKADMAWWEAPGTPILIWQSFLAWILAALLLLSERDLLNIFSKWKWRNAVLDLLIVASLWIFSAWLWGITPIQSDHFITPQMAPNGEFYPYSDAATYDLSAQDLLVGNGFANTSGSKPAYSLFLALLHLIAGQDYERVVLLQSLIMGMIPALMFLVTSRLGNRSAGLAAGLLLIFREQNSINLTNEIRVSSVKMLMTESLTLAVILLLVLLFVHWFEEPGKRSPLLIWIGGFLGVSILLRGQMLVLVPFFFLILILVTGKDRASFLRAGSMILLGTVLVISPWMLRNFQSRTGISLKEALPRDWMMATKYSLTPEVRLEPPPGVALDEYNERMRAQVVQFVLQHPDEVVRFISAHFFHNQIESIIYLPLSLRIETPLEYVKRVPYWAEGWDSSFPMEGRLLLFVNLCLIVTGVGVAWAAAGRRILIPILICLGYVFSVSIARFSGYRFIMPSDWISVLFYSIGAVQLIRILYGLVIKGYEVREVKASNTDTRVRYPRMKSVVFLSTGMLLLGMVFPLSQKMFPVVYPKLSKQAALQMYADALKANPQEGAPALSTLTAFARQDNAVVFHGRALYPRYFRAGQGLGGNNPVYNTPPDSSLIFSIVGSAEGTLVVLPLKGKLDQFPNASDVLVFGCPGTGSSISAFAVVLLGDKPLILKQRFTDQVSCPLVFP